MSEQENENRQRNDPSIKGYFGGEVDPTRRSIETILYGRNYSTNWKSRSYNSCTLLIAIPTLLILPVVFAYALYTWVSEGVDLLTLICVVPFVALGGGYQIVKFSKYLLGEINRSVHYVFVKASGEGQEGQLVSINKLSQELGENPSIIRRWCLYLNIRSNYLNIEQAELIRYFILRSEKGSK
jgi:hypothetical protein